MYTPQPNDEGIQLLLAAIRDYIASDASSIELLPEGAAGVLPEGFLTDTTPTPTILIANLGDGKTEAGAGIQLVRLIVYVMDRGRGYYNIEKVLHRLRGLFNDTPRALEYLTFPASEPLRVLSFNASGTTASATFPQWKCEGRGLYLFVEVSGLPTAT